MQVRGSIISKAFEGFRTNWCDYAALPKPRVISPLLLTTLVAMLIAGESIPPPLTIF